ncbi:hypothetical protein E3N88_44708 [Mikania micrantha]|uniref:DUF3741 domain-containing protein n=1 Tax=Mikania micrantha TaxID=192012 RepID=A0A5N6LB96_9ASTR|nr:hypothetical protein E3N88_44708 [Mikania micrantha]
MAAKVVHTQREDKQGLQKHLGCMNGIFQLFDRRYLSRTAPPWPDPEPANCRCQLNSVYCYCGGENEFKNSSEKAKVKMKNEKNHKKMTIEKNRASVESSRNSFSSSSSSTTFSSFDCSKRVQTKWQLPSEPTSPNLHKQPDWSSPPTDIRDVVKESMTREIRVTKMNAGAQVSQYLKSTFKVKEPPRLSLDSKQNSNCKSMNWSRSELVGDRRPSSGVVARLMGLDSLIDSGFEAQTLKNKQAFSDQLVSNSPRVHAKIKPALQQHEGDDRTYKKPSGYGEMEKMFDAIKINTYGKDLRALKQILEAIQMSKTLDLQKPDQPYSPMVKGTSSPKRHKLVNQAMEHANMAPEPKMITKHHNVNHTDRKQVNNQTSKKMKTTDWKPSERLQKSKNGVEKQCINRPSSDSSRNKVKKQSNLQIKQPVIKPINNGLQNNKQSFEYSNDDDTVSFISKHNSNQASQSKLQVTRNEQPKENHRNNLAETMIEDKPMDGLAKLSVEQESPVSVLDAFYIEDTPSPIKNKPNVFNNNENLHHDQTEWNRAGIADNIHADQYNEFNHVKQENRDSPLQQTQLINSMDERLASPSKSTNTDQEYIREILSASCLLKDLDSAIRIVQLHPTSSLIKPELFQILENPNVEDDEKSTGSKSTEKI